jgi:hypothetical protein
MSPKGKFMEGELVPIIVMIGFAYLMMRMGPHVPHSPIACLQRDNCKPGHQIEWVAGLIFVAPIFVGIAFKRLRYELTR